MSCPQIGLQIDDKSSRCRMIRHKTTKCRGTRADDKMSQNDSIGNERQIVVIYSWWGAELISNEVYMRMNTYDQLFRTPDSNEKTREINLRDLHEFEGHPFRVVDDEDMEELVQSIRERGILVPVMVRTRPEGGYEIISGHRRCHAARLAGLFKVPVVIAELTDEEAVDAMIYTNFQRSTILPSEKAQAYRLQMEAIRHPGICGPSSPGTIGRKYGDNARKVQRYIRLTFLIDELLALVDQEKLCMQAGYSLSFIKPEHQRWVLQVFRETGLSGVGLLSGPEKIFCKILLLCAGSVMIGVLYSARTQEKQTQYLKK